MFLYFLLQTDCLIDDCLGFLVCISPLLCTNGSCTCFPRWLECSSVLIYYNFHTVFGQWLYCKWIILKYQTWAVEKQWVRGSSDVSNLLSQVLNIKASHSEPPSHFIHQRLSKTQHMWCGILESVNVLTLVQAVVSIPAFRHTVTTTYYTRTQESK